MKDGEPRGGESSQRSSAGGPQVTFFSIEILSDPSSSLEGRWAFGDNGMDFLLPDISLSLGWGKARGEYFSFFFRSR